MKEQDQQSILAPPSAKETRANETSANEIGIQSSATTASDIIGGNRIGAQIFLSNLEIVARWVGAALVLGVAVWAISNALVTLRQQAETRKIEARRPFLERQLALYTETTQVTSKLATATDENERKQAEARFWELYWGELATVENGEVEAAMVELGKCVTARNNGQPCSPSITILALHVACACRRSLAQSWAVEDLGISNSCKERS